MNSLLFFAANTIIRDKNKTIKENKKSNSDFYCEICVIPIEDKILCLYYGKTKEFLDVINSFKEIESYYYFNNFDRPDEISKEEWEQRAIDWEKALPGDGIPSENGFIIKLINDLPFISSSILDKAIKKIPSFEERIQRLAKRKVIYDKLEKESFAYLSAALEWIETKNGQKEVDKKKNELYGIIPKEITKEMIENLTINKLLNNYK